MKNVDHGTQQVKNNIMERFFDDGHYRWEYRCKYHTPTNNIDDYYYYIAFESEEGGYMTDDEINCNYYHTQNIITISKFRGVLKFYVENFQDIYQILNPLIKANKAKIYSRFKSVSEERREKINNINSKL